VLLGPYADSRRSAEEGPAWPGLPFEVVIALVVLGLCVLYAIVFSRMVYDSLLEQVIAPHPHLPRYAGPPHAHHPVEWILLVLPSIIGWVGAIGCLRYLLRRRLRR
jgi:hypothetical protein